MNTPSAVASKAALITLIVDRGGRHEDLAFPTGITLHDALEAIDAGDLSPFAVTGAPLSSTAVLGKDLNSGAFIVLRRSGWDHAGNIRPVDHSDEVRAANVSTAVSVLAIAAGVVVSGGVLYFQSVEEAPSAPQGYAWLMAACVAVALLLSCRKSHGKPLLETGGSAALVTAGALIGTFANPGDPTHQALFTAMLGISLVSLVRWLCCGRASPDVGNVCIDAAILAMLIGLLDMLVMEMGQPIALTAALIFGVCPPILAAISGFSVRVPSDMLLDSASVIREAPAVRSAPVSADVESPDVPLLLSISLARNRFWTLMASLGAVLTAPTMVALTAAPGWRGVVALLALLTAVATCLLMPRKTSSHFVRIVPRISAAAIIVMLALLGDLPFPHFVVAVALAGTGLLFLGASFLVHTDYQFYGFSRLGDIVQSLCVVASLPLSLAAVGVISLVRSGGLG